MMYNIPLRFKSNVCDFLIQLKIFTFYANFSIVIIVGIRVVTTSVRSSQCDGRIWTQAHPCVTSV
jgi:hypothetical protein